MTEHPTERQLTVGEAAGVLGISVDAVRMRVRRGTLQSEKDSTGRVYVYLNDDSSKTKHRLDSEPTALISAKDETIAVLREQLEAERDAHAEARRIIAGLVSRVPELSAPASADPTAAETDESPGPTRTPNDAHGGPQAAAQRRSWWSRVFGG
jgi:DNA-binding transcriptional MerR regulator